MGKFAPTGGEIAATVIAGTFAATGVSTPTPFKGYFNIWLSGTFVGTVKVQASYDGGTNYIPVSLDTSGNQASYTAPTKVICFEPEPGVLYQLNCTAYTSGTVIYRMSEAGYSDPAGTPLRWN